MLGEVNRSLELLSDSGEEVAQPMEKDEFVIYLSSQLMEQGYKMNEINEIDICSYIEIMAYKMDKKQEEKVNSLLF